MSTLGDIVSSPWLNGLGLVIGFIGLVLATIGIWLAFRFRLHSNLRYAVSSRPILKLTRDFSFIKATINDTAHTEVTGVKLLLWNAGNSSLKADDVREMPAVSANLPASMVGKFIAAEALFSDTSDTNVAVDYHEDEINIKFDVLGPKEGLLIAFVIDFPSKYLEINGRTYDSSSIRKSIPFFLYKLSAPVIAIMLAIVALFITYFLWFDVIGIKGINLLYDNTKQSIKFPGGGLALVITFIALVFGSGYWVERLMRTLFVRGAPQSFFEFDRSIDPNHRQTKLDVA